LQHQLEVFLQRLQILLVLHFLFEDLQNDIIGDRIGRLRGFQELLVRRNGALLT